MSMWPLAAGVGVAVAAIGGRTLFQLLRAGSARAAAAEGAAGGAAAADAAAASGWGKRFYEGGFEPTMTRREAAMILGCRESSDKAKVMERYRQLMKLNHPDLGGSPYLSQKINEAKAMLATRARSAADEAAAEAAAAANTAGQVVRRKGRWSPQD